MEQTSERQATFSTDNGRRDMSKYIIEIKPEYEDKFKGVMILGAENSNLYVDSQTVDELEELNPDYINELFGSLQDDAYKRGLEDAWKAARKIAEMWETIDNDELLGIFGLTAKIGESTIGTLFKKQTAAEAIEKLKACEEKQKADDKIEVGDEVTDKDGDKTIVTNIHGDLFDGLCSDGSTMTDLFLDDNRKTGRHFDIAQILEAMKHD